MAAELDVVAVRGASALEHEDKLMLRTIVRSHPCVALDPNADILKLRVRLFPSRENFERVPPIHALKMQRPVDAIAHEEVHPGRKKMDELAGGLLTRSTQKFAMLKASLAARMAGNWDVVGKIGKNNLSAFSLHQHFIRRSIERIAA